jgi:hypothetical protein
MVYSTPTHGILTPISTVFWSPTRDISTPYPWLFSPTIHGTLNPLPMVFWPPFHISPLSMLFLPAYPWYIEHPTYAILTHLSMVLCCPLDYKWGASTYHRSQIYHTGGRFSISGLNILWMKIYPGVKIPWESKYHMSARTLWKSIQFCLYQFHHFTRVMFQYLCGLLFFF